MPDQSTILSLPYILPAQAQKHVTHNEALRLLDVIVQLTVQDRSRTAPPASPATGARHIVAAGAGGDWAGQDHRIALWEGTAWAFFAPLTGWRAYVEDEGAEASFDGAAWVALADGPLEVGQLGVSASPDATNRLSVAAPASLFSHDGAGHQVKINKAAAGDTASLMFQTGFSGRAEIGTTGSDDLAVKVSADGTSYREAVRVARTTGIVSLPQGVASDGLVVRDPSDTSKGIAFSAAAVTTGTLRTFTLPDASSTLAVLGAVQNFTGNTTFSANVNSLGTSAGNSTLGVGTGATLSGNTKTVNLGTAGAAGSTTVINVGSVVAGALGTTVFNSPTVTFANSVTSVAMPEAAVTAKTLGLGGAVGDATNRLSVNTPAVLLNSAGAGIEATLNKAGPGNDAAIAFKTGFSARALVGLLGNDSFTLKVSPNGSSFTEALTADAATGRVGLAQPLILSDQAAQPAPPVAGTLALYSRSRAGSGWVDVQRPSGRTFALQPHFGVNRIATWAPSTGNTVNTNGMPRTAVGTTSTPGLAATNLISSMRRWRQASAATAGSVAEERSAGWVCWRGNAAGLGGWSYVNRLSLQAVQPTGMAFFGLYGSTAALSTSLTLGAVSSCVGVGFQAGTHSNWQIVVSDGSSAPTLTDLGPAFPAGSTSTVLSIYLACSVNGSEIGVRVVEEVSGTAVELAATTNIPSATQFLSPRNYMNNGATAAAVAYECSGVYVETDF